MSEPPFSVRALYEYNAEQDDDLPFAPGQRLTVDKVLDEDWYHGHYVDSSSGKRLEGIFPINYVEVEVPPSRPQRRAPSSHATKQQSTSTPTADSPSVESSPATNPPGAQPPSLKSIQPVEPITAENPHSSGTQSPASVNSAQPKQPGEPERQDMPAHLAPHLVKARKHADAADDDDWGDDQNSEDEEEKEIVFGAPNVVAPPETTAQKAAGEIPKAASEAEEKPKVQASEETSRQTVEKPSEKPVETARGEPKDEITDNPAKSQTVDVAKEAANTKDAKGGIPITDDPPTASRSVPDSKPSDPADRQRFPLGRASRSPHFSNYPSTGGEESESEPMTSVSYDVQDVHALSRQQDQPSFEKKDMPIKSRQPVSENLSQQKKIDEDAFKTIDSAPKISRPYVERPLDVDELSESEHAPDHSDPSLGTSPSTSPNEIVTDKEPDFKTRLARFNQGYSEHRDSDAKRPERHPTFGREMKFGHLEEESERPKRTENLEDYKPSVSLKERIAMLQKSQQQEQEAAEADAAAEDRRKARRAQAVADSEANRKMRQEREAKEAKEVKEQRGTQVVATQPQDDNEKPEEIQDTIREKIVAATQKVKETKESAEAEPVKPTGSSNVSPRGSTHFRGDDATNGHGGNDLRGKLSELKVTESPEEEQKQSQAAPPAPPAISNVQKSEGSTSSDQPAPKAPQPPRVPETTSREAVAPEKEHDTHATVAQTSAAPASHDDENEDDEDDNAEARRIALRERMARLANSTGGMNLGMIMGGGGFGGPGGPMPKRERRISRSEYEAMSPAEIEAAEARREAEESAPVNIFGVSGGPPPPARHDREEEGEDGKEESVKDEPSQGESGSIKSAQHHSVDSPSSPSAELPETPKNPAHHATDSGLESETKSPESGNVYHDASDLSAEASTEGGAKDLDRIPSALRPQAPPAKVPEVPHSAENSQAAAAAAAAAPPPPTPPQPPHAKDAQPPQSIHRVNSDISFEFEEAMSQSDEPRHQSARSSPVPPAVAPPYFTTSRDSPNMPPTGSPPGTPVLPEGSEAYPHDATPPPVPESTSESNGKHRNPPPPPSTAPQPTTPAPSAPPQPPKATSASAPAVPAPPQPTAHPAAQHPGGPHTAPPPPPPPAVPPPHAPATPTRTSDSPASPSGPPPPAPGDRPAPAPGGLRTSVASHHYPPPPPPPPQAGPAPPSPGQNQESSSSSSTQGGSAPVPIPLSTAASASRQATFSNSPPPPPPVARPVDDYTSASPQRHNEQEIGSLYKSRTRDSVATTRSSVSSYQAQHYGHHGGSTSSTTLNGAPATSYSSGAGTNWINTPRGIPPNLVLRGETYKVTDSATERQILVVHHNWSQTVYIYSLSSGEQLSHEDHPPPHNDAHSLKELSHRLGPSIVQIAHEALHDADSSTRWVSRVLDTAGALHTDKSLGIQIYTNLGNASVQQIDEIRAGDICMCEDADFQGSRGPLHKYHKTYNSSVFIVSEWDGTKRKLHFVDNKKESMRLGDLRMGVVRIFRAVDAKYLSRH